MGLAVIPTSTRHHLSVNKSSYIAVVVIRGAQVTVGSLLLQITSEYSVGPPFMDPVLTRPLLTITLVARKT